MMNPPHTTLSYSNSGTLSHCQQTHSGNNAQTMDYQLCERCHGLDLGVDKFRIRHDNSTTSSLPLESLRSTSERHPLGTFQSIQDRSLTCVLCKLICSSIPPETRGDSTPGVDQAHCYLIWEVDGRDSPDPFDSKRTRRLRIRWSDQRLKSYQAYLILAAPSKYDESDLDYPNLLNCETQFLGRRIGPAVSKRSLIREFLRLCEDFHDERCTRKLGIEDPFSATLGQPYFGVIDIQSERLVPLPSYREDGQLVFKAYATVSYVWGTIRDHRTTLANIQDRRKLGGLAQTISELPIALRQSVSLASSLGIRYIWIDSLCIIQDSSHSWNLNSRAMHLIYGNSLLTICAADGDSASTGLLALEESNRTDQKIAKCTPDVHLLLHDPPENSIETSIWNSRAWTFQERLLSRRCLIFTRKQIYFQCRSTSCSEDAFADKRGRGWSLDLIGAPLQTLTQLSQRALWFYANCVDLYTKRDLYEPFDILAAFSGMCRLMEGTLQAPVVFGLPTSHFDFALLWEPVAESHLLQKPLSPDEKYKSMRLPSWSWCGWGSQGIKYKHAMVEGCLVDMRAWLKDHTWIDWHIRDGYGTPQRIWDAAWSRDDNSTDARWRGYLGDSNSGLTNDSESCSTERDSASDRSSGSDHFRMEKDPRIIVRGERVTDRTKSRERRQSPPDCPPEYPRRPILREVPRHARARGPSPPRLRPRFLEESRMLGRRIDTAADAFGRPLQGPALKRVRAHAAPNQSFQLSLPEYPFHVPAAESRARTGAHREFPDLPILQFFTWASEFHVIPATPSPGHEGAPSANGTPAGGDQEGDQEGDFGGELHRCHIIDGYGDKCGSILVDSRWLQRRRPATTFEFIAISEAKCFMPEEMPDWTYYIPKERAESEWDLYYVLLIEHYPKDGLWKRIALGKVFQAAFSHRQEEWKEIILG